MSKRKYKVTFVDRWLEDDKFKAWLRKVEKDTYSAKYSICCKTFGILNMGESALISHMKGKKHCEGALSVSGSQSSYFSESESADLSALREKCPKTEFFLVRIFLYSD